MDSTRKALAEEALKSAMHELFGDEKKIIVQNTQPGVISIGFGKQGNEGGYTIPRSRLPMCLTDTVPAEIWLASPDFRQALTKGWIKLVSETDYNKAVEADRAHKARLEELAAADSARTAPRKFDAEINPLQEQVIDEATSSVRPVDLAKAVQDYEKNLERPPQVDSLRDGRSARAEALVEETKRATTDPLTAIEKLDNDEKLYTDEDLQYIANNSAYPGLSSFARNILDSRTKK